MPVRILIKRSDSGPMDTTRGTERSLGDLERSTGLNAPTVFFRGVAAICLAFMMVNGQLWGQNPAQSPGVGTSSSPEVLRRQCDDLLARARQAIAERNYDGAEQLLQQAESLGVKYPPLYLGDTPEKVRRALENARGSRGTTAGQVQDPFGARNLTESTPDPKTQAKTYVRNGRMALIRGNLTEAAQWCQMAAALPATFGPEEDSPTKLAEDIRKMGGQVSVGASSTPPSVNPLPPVGQITQVAPPANASGKSPAQMQSDQWLLEARRALALGDVKTARRYLDQVRSLGLTYGRFEDSPERVEALIQTHENLMAQKAERSQTEGWRRLYAKLLLEEADGLLRWGDLDEAERLAQLAAQQGITFSPFEMKPETLLQRISAERARRAQGSDLAAQKQRVLQILAQARAALAAGDLSTAETLANQAAMLRVSEGAFSPQEDSPGRLLADIQQMKQRLGVQPVGAQAVVPAAGAYNGNVAAAAVYDPTRDMTRNIPAGVYQQAPATPGSPFSPETTAPPAGESRGMALVRQAEEALRRGDHATAMEYFRQSTAYFNEMDPVTVQRVQDVLQQEAARAVTQAATNPGLAAPDAMTQQQLATRQLVADISLKESQALSLREKDPEKALQILQEARKTVDNATLDLNTRDQLLRRLDRQIADFQYYLEQNRPRIEREKKNQEVTQKIAAEQQSNLDRQSKLAELVEQYNQLMREQRFAEAEVVAKKAAELDPDNPVTKQLVLNARFIRQYSESMAIRDQKEQGFLAQLASVDKASIPFDDSNPYVMPDAKSWADLTKRRSKLAEAGRQRSARELEIEQKLNTLVMLQFENAPLGRVLDYLAKLVDVNIHVDPAGLASEGVTTDTPVTISLTQEISLKSALNLVLEPLHLSYVIKDDVLKITSEQYRRGTVYPVVYNVADLVSPIPNFRGEVKTLADSYSTALAQLGVNQTGSPLAPVAVVATRDGSKATAGVNPSILAQMSTAAAHASPGGTNAPITTGPGGMGGAALADFQSLIDLIETTVAPDTWDTVGGPGSISPFPTNLSLVISQTQEVHEQISDLLEQLRRMQDLQVTVEVRFITLNDNFFERIGVDFDFDIDDKIDGRRGVRFGQIVQQGDPTGDAEEQLDIRDLRDRDSGKGVTVGLSAPNVFSADLDIPFRQGSFSLAVPQFGGYDPTAGAQLGFAILSDIEAFFFIEAAQGDRRSNVLQAPKVTLFNGQYGIVADQSTSPFVISVIPVVGDFAAAQQPVVTMVHEGTFLTVQPVVSQDRRFVRMTIIPYFARIKDVNEFTFTGSETTTESTSAEGNQQTPNDNTKNANSRSTTRSGTTVQLPTVASFYVLTTVSVPDGGTVLLGGIKRLSEGRNEFGVPMLDKIPYINRLFKNVGVGRETQSLMMMVTPRIIIAEEEEEKLGITQ
jgi:general secretion pathway protein D